MRGNHVVANYCSAHARCVIAQKLITAVTLATVLTMVIIVSVTSYYYYTIWMSLSQAFPSRYFS